MNQMGKTCLESWRKYFPDYEIKEWNEENFDVTSTQYIREAYDAKKWAFVSDYARFKILYEQGGLYFDTDVEVVKPFEDILKAGTFMGYESGRGGVAPGLGLGATPGLKIYKEILDDYDRSSFTKLDGTYDLTTVVQRTTQVLKRHGLKETNKIQNVGGITVYPAEYFCPIDMESGKLTITNNTHSIHRYAASWVSPYNLFRGKVYRFIYRYFGKSGAHFARKIVGKK